MEKDAGWLDLWHDLRMALLGALAVACAALYFLRSSRPTARTTSLTAPVEKTAVSPPALAPPPPPSAPLSVPSKQVSRNAPRRIQGGLKKASAVRGGSLGTKEGRKEEDDGVTVQPLVFFSSLTGTTEGYAKQVVEALDKDVGAAAATSPTRGRVLPAQLHDLSYIDYDDYFVSIPTVTPSSQEGRGPAARYFYLILLPTYNIDSVLNNFLDHLKETHHDFRIDTGALSGLLGYSVFGFGDREGWPTEEEGFCSQAKDVDRWMAKLTDRKRAYPLGMGDVKAGVKDDLRDWQEGVREVLCNIAEGRGLGEGVVGSGDAVESEQEEESEVEEEEEQGVPPRQSRRTQKKKKGVNASATLADLEDLGAQAAASSRGEDEGGSGPAPLAIDFTTVKTKTLSRAPVTIKAMVPKSSPTYAALTKQGYSIIGSHSGVKICRWTKSALRGRGSCYKRSFYGIASHLCMEATPSLSCSNKCVFCWRHGTNPVGTTWRWEVDAPDMILEGALEAHGKKIKMMRGVPGLRADRFAQALRVRHCALSLVGEPIFYPRINEFLRLLHGRRISSFLVCNAQHPAQLEALDRVTQLYVSIDASNRESLRKVDRPLHRDFWERFQQCLDILRAARFRQRTVFRLTLVKGFNVEDEVEGYADLVQRALPGFVEVKGVTYCGTSGSSAAGLTMQNVPFWAEVQHFVTALHRALARRGLGYGMAAEHAHSCCALLADEDRFRVDGRWHTIIDYDRFFDLLESGADFRPEDYIGEATPEWAAWGKGGFDPLDVRVDRKGKPIQASSATPAALAAAAAGIVSN